MISIKPELPEFEELRERLQNALGENFNVDIDKEISYSFGLFWEHFDLVVFCNNEPIAAIEYKSTVFRLYQSLHSDFFISKFHKINIKYGILYFGRDDEFYLYCKGGYNLNKIDFEGIINSITNNRCFGKRPSADDVRHNINKCMTDNNGISNEQTLTFNNIFTERTLNYDEERGVISFLEQYEDEFFLNLLPKIEHKSLCRYTSLDSLFRLLKDKKHCMCSITCMNDKGEVSYADSYMWNGIFALSRKSVEENNNCFIISCCDEEKVDDLTMWRLYADNAKGACIEYDVDISKIDNKSFFIAPVSYGEKERHIELDIIRNIMHWEKNGWRFELKRWYIWKHFFKSYLFKDEKEVRLLFVPGKDNKDEIQWIMDSTNKIASRICLFPLDKFPLTLKSAMIGPKCPELYSNVDQFSYMNIKQQVFSEKGRKKAIMPSNIRDYR